MKNYKETNDEPSKELLDLRGNRSQLCSMLDTCYSIATEHLTKKSLLEDRINLLKRDVCQCKNQEELNKLAYEVISFVHEFICFRN